MAYVSGKVMENPTRMADGKIRDTPSWFPKERGQKVCGYCTDINPRYPNHRYHSAAGQCMVAVREDDGDTMRLCACNEQVEVMPMKT